MQQLMGQLVRVARECSLTLEELETELRKQFITAVLQDCKGNQCKAAVQLRVHRNSLNRTIRILQINAREIRGGKKPAVSVMAPNVQRVRGHA